MMWRRSASEFRDIQRLTHTMGILMAKIDDLNAVAAQIAAGVTANGVATQSVLAMVQALQAQVAGGTGVTDAQLQAVIDTLTPQVAALGAQDAALSAVVPAPAA